MEDNETQEDNETPEYLGNETEFRYESAFDRWRDSEPPLAMAGFDGLTYPEAIEKMTQALRNPVGIIYQPPTEPAAEMVEIIRAMMKAEIAPLQDQVTALQKRVEALEQEQYRRRSYEMEMAERG